MTTPSAAEREKAKRQGGAFFYSASELRREISRLEKLLDELRHRALVLEALEHAKAGKR
jgi:hypothetical protein